MEFLKFLNISELRISLLNSSLQFLTCLRQAHWSNAFRELHRFPELEQSDVVVVRIHVEVPMANYCAHCPHYCWSIGVHVLIVISQNNTDFGAF